MNALSLESDIPVIRAPMLRRALISGARRVISQRDYLNKINVFPVPDGDTGSNLAFTLGNVLTGALSRRTAGPASGGALAASAYGGVTLADLAQGRTLRR